MKYPAIPLDLKQAPYSELERAAQALRDYKNVTILNIRHWRAIPELLAAAKQVTKDQRRVLREIKARPEFAKRALIETCPKCQSGDIVEYTSFDGQRLHCRNCNQNWQPTVQQIKRAAQQPEPEKINSGDRVHSTFHNADGEVIRLEWSARVGGIYHVRLDNGSVVFCHVSDLSLLGSNTKLEERR